MSVWDVPGPRERVPVASGGQAMQTSQLASAVLQDRGLRGNRFGAILAMLRAGDVATPARDWVIHPDNYGVAPSAGLYPFRVVEGVVATVPLPLPRSDGRTVGEGSGIETRGGMRIGTRGRRVHLRATLTDLETGATSTVVMEHGEPDGWLNADVALPVGCRSGNRIRIDVDARWTSDTEPARVGAVCCWWGGAQDIRGTGIVMFGDATIWIEDSFASRPTLNLRTGDLLLIDGGATPEEGWSFSWTGSAWALRTATVATWANRPLPGTLPSGAVLADGSAVVIASSGRTFRWVTLELQASAGGDISLWVPQRVFGDGSGMTLRAAVMGDESGADKASFYDALSARGMPEQNLSGDDAISSAGDHIVVTTGPVSWHISTDGVGTWFGDATRYWVYAELRGQTTGGSNGIQINCSGATGTANTHRLTFGGTGGPGLSWGFTAIAESANQLRDGGINAPDLTDPFQPVELLDEGRAVLSHAFIESLPYASARRQGTTSAVLGAGLSKAGAGAKTIHIRRFIVVQYT